MMPISSLDGYTRSAFSATLSASLLFGVLALTGCSGAVSIPDTSVPSNVIHPGAIQGSVLGGHAPIVGAHVYVFEVGKTGYASAATSELTTGSGTDSIGTYVTTDSSGAFNVTDDYSCDVGQPVYLASVGGSSTANSSVTITAATFTETGSSGHYTITFTGNNTLVFGQLVTFSGLSVANGYSQLDGTTQSVTAATATTFTIQVTLGHNSLSGSTTGTATYDINNSIIEMAVLGLCPGTSGEFANTLSFVYMNEVSTAAAAFAFSGFGSGPYDIGASSTNLLGIQNAAVNAGQLYDIQGSDISTTQDGEGHIARSTTPDGNGTVAQATLDTLGDILSTCVDSSGSTSAQCTTLFTYATSTGSILGKQPTDTATAMFNIAHFPAGTGLSSFTFMSNLYALQNSGIVPYTPNLAAQPNDFTVSISYTGGGLGTTNGKSPHSVAIDASGNVYTVNYASSLLNIFSPFGVPLSDTGFNGNGLNEPVSIAVDSTSKNLWIANFGSSAVSEFTTSGAAVNTYPLGESAQRDAEIDSSGNIWVATDSSNALVELTSGGTVDQTVTSNLQGPWCIAIEPAAGNIWVTDQTENDVTVSTSGGSTTRYNTAGITTPIGCAIDSNGDAWLANSNGTLSALINGRGANQGKNLGFSPFLSGSSNVLDGIAIDGADNIWVTNSTSQTLYELSSAEGTFISPTDGYTAKPATSPDGIAIDPSGDVWYNSSSSDVLYELVGAATPTVTPISFAVTNSKLGTQP